MNAPGAVVRDLFDAEAVYVENPALMAELAEKKLASERDSWLAQGWGWVETSLGQGRTDGGYAAMRLQPDWREYTDEEEAELTRLRDELDALDAALDEDSIEEDPRWENETRSPPQSKPCVSQPASGTRISSHTLAWSSRSVMTGKPMPRWALSGSLTRRRSRTSANGWRGQRPVMTS
jgi:hypothetical protein